jgi:hypothetical protein
MESGGFLQFFNRRPGGRKRASGDHGTIDKDPLALALKSGNFGAPDFFTSAFNKLPN